MSHYSLYIHSNKNSTFYLIRESVIEANPERIDLSLNLDVKDKAIASDTLYIVREPSFITEGNSACPCQNTFNSDHL